MGPSRYRRKIAPLIHFVLQQDVFEQRYLNRVSTGIQSAVFFESMQAILERNQLTGSMLAPLVPTPRLPGFPVGKRRASAESEDQSGPEEYMLTALVSNGR